KRRHGVDLRADAAMRSTDSFATSGYMREAATHPPGVRRRSPTPVFGSADAAARAAPAVAARCRRLSICRSRTAIVHGVAFLLHASTIFASLSGSMLMSPLW